jgi:uncharacterized protein (TIGR02246 family)
MRIACLALAGSLAFAGVAAAQSKDAAMEKLAADWTAAYAKADAKTLAGYYTEHAVRLTAEGGTVIGRAAIEKEFTSNFAGPWKGTQISIKVGSIHPVSAGVAVNEGTYEISGIHGPDGKPAPNVKGNYLNTVIKKNGAWVIASNCGVAPLPPPAAGK